MSGQFVIGISPEALLGRSLMPESNDFRPAPMSYFQLILRRFGDSETLRAAILEGSGVSEADLDDPQVELRFSQQVRQFDNMNRLFGEGWPLDAPELWRPAAHGALGVAVMSSPNVAAAMEVLARYVPQPGCAPSREPAQDIRRGRAPRSGVGAGYAAGRGNRRRAL